MKTFNRLDFIQVVDSNTVKLVFSNDKRLWVKGKIDESKIDEIRNDYTRSKIRGKFTKETKETLQRRLTNKLELIARTEDKRFKLDRAIIRLKKSVEEDRELLKTIEHNEKLRL